jgi:hypothetical protein
MSNRGAAKRPRRVAPPILSRLSGTTYKTDSRAMATFLIGHFGARTESVSGDFSEEGAPGVAGTQEDFVMASERSESCPWGDSLRSG